VPEHLLLGVPRLSPERELAVILALIKPQARNRIEHRLDNGEQPWPPDGAARVRALAAVAREHLGFDAEFHCPGAGEYFAVASVPREAEPAALAAALLVSAQFPSLWVVVGRLFLRDQTFFRRERGVKLNLRPANDVHLTKPMRASFREAAKALIG
jgi:hypothetical protein